MVDKKLIESDVYRLKDLTSLKKLFVDLNYNIADEPIDKENWGEEIKEKISESKIIAKLGDFRIFYIKNLEGSTNELKKLASKIISKYDGKGLVCIQITENQDWMFSTLSKDFSKNFRETRHVKFEVKSNKGIPKSVLEFFQSIFAEGSNSLQIFQKMSNGFDNFALKIHDELTVNVFEAFKILSEGVIMEKKNGFNLSYENLEKIREPIFILLYRIIFVLYAEERNIFPIENKIYHEQFSLKWIKKEWLLKQENIEKLNEYEIQDRLKRLFHLIEIGSKELEFDSDEFFMRSYYGRLFDRVENSKLEKWKIPNEFLINAINFLTRTKDNKQNYYFLDYSALEIRHLGSIYEHLLEFHLKVEGKKISELPNPKDRKLSGSYYTPKYVVDFIVQNSIEPHIKQIMEEKSNKIEKIEKILSLKILDPAMGSGHFLTGAVEYIAKRICEIEYDIVNEKQYIERKRDVVRQCIYGVDVNPLAVDLAKVSLWLETLSSDKPLTFLSAHLKHGNSLVGESVDNIFDPQQTILESTKKSHFKKIVKDYLGFESLEDDTASAVKAKVEKYSHMREKGSFYHQLRGLLDHSISSIFGVKAEPIGDLRQKIGVESLDFYSSKSGKTVHEVRKTHNFFHWEIEFPEVFFTDKGDKKKNPGFDIVLGNPPYIRVQSASAHEKKFLEDAFVSSKGKYDVYILFLEQSLKLLKKEGICGFIVPNKYLHTKYGDEIKKYILENAQIRLFVDFGDLKVFQDATTYPSIIVMKKSKIDGESNYIKVKELSDDIGSKLLTHTNELNYIDPVVRAFRFSQSNFNVKNWIFLPNNALEIFKKINSHSKFKEFTEKNIQGFITGKNPVYMIKNPKKDSFEKEILKKAPKGKDIRKFVFPFNELYVVYTNDELGKSFSEAVMKKKFPKTFNYLKSFKEELSKRRYFNKNVADICGTWFSLVHPVPANLFNQTKIITPNLAKTNQFALDTEKYYVEHDCYLITLKEKSIKEYYYYIGILNSKVSEFVIKTISPMFSGGFYKYHTQYVERVPIVKIETKEQKMIKGKISELVEKVIKLNKESISDNNKEIISEIKDTENEIDKHVFQLYDISKEEQKIIMENIH